MENIDNRIEEYRIKAENAVKKTLKDYPSLRDMEIEFCEIINEGNNIRKFLISNPEIIDRKSYLFLTNQVKEQTILADKYQPLLLVMFLSKILYETYVEYAKDLEEKQQYEELINIYTACFNLSGLTSYKKCIADIIFEHFDNIPQAIAIYEEISKDYSSDYQFHEQYAKMYSAIGDNENAQKNALLATEFKHLAEAKNFIEEKDFGKAIDIYEKLYKRTDKCEYKLEIANIYAVCYSKIDKAIEIYKSLESRLNNDKDYWYKLSELYEYVENYFRQVLCMQKAIKLELSQDFKGVE